MIFIFGTPENALSVHLFNKYKGNNEFKTVRNKTPGITFEILSDKKTGLKVVGFSNVINYLAKNQANNATHDFYCWLTTSFNLQDTFHERIAQSRIGESEIYDIYLYSKLHFGLRQGKAVPQTLLEFYTAQDKTYAAEAQKFISLNFEEEKKDTNQNAKNQNQKDNSKGKNQNQNAKGQPKQPEAKAAPAEKKAQAPKKKEEVPQEYLDLVNK